MTLHDCIWQMYYEVDTARDMAHEEAMRCIDNRDRKGYERAAQSRRNYTDCLKMIIKYL